MSIPRVTSLKVVKRPGPYNTWTSYLTDYAEAVQAFASRDEAEVAIQFNSEFGVLDAEWLQEVLTVSPPSNNPYQEDIKPFLEITHYEYDYEFARRIYVNDFEMTTLKEGSLNRTAEVKLKVDKFMLLLDEFMSGSVVQPLGKPVMPAINAHASAAVLAHTAFASFFEPNSVINEQQTATVNGSLATTRTFNLTPDVPGLPLVLILVFYNPNSSGVTVTVSVNSEFRTVLTLQPQSAIAVDTVRTLSGGTKQFNINVSVSPPTSSVSLVRAYLADPDGYFSVSVKNLNTNNEIIPIREIETFAGWQTIGGDRVLFNRYVVQNSFLAGSYIYVTTGFYPCSLVAV